MYESSYHMNGHLLLLGAFFFSFFFLWTLATFYIILSKLSVYLASTQPIFYLYYCLIIVVLGVLFISYYLFIFLEMYGFCQ